MSLITDDDLEQAPAMIDLASKNGLVETVGCPGALVERHLLWLPALTVEKAKHTSMLEIVYRHWITSFYRWFW